MFKVPEGTKAKLRRLDRNISALLREQVEQLITRRHSESAHQKASQLCGVIQGGPKNASTSRDYLNQWS